MNKDKDNNETPPGDEERTVYQPFKSEDTVPAAGAASPAAPAAETTDAERTASPASPAPASGEATMISPAGTPGSPAGTAPGAGAPTMVPGMTQTFATAFAPRTDGKAIQEGDVLNHIFEVKRFLARGGMGEVFEGVNINTDERVAIKVMLPALAADANVVAMFRKEARTLTRLQHEALVQYRVLAQEPQLGVLYIVTEFIEGTNLNDVLGTIKATPDQLKELLRRLAAGLRVAHALGAVHRDLSPDNVLLAGGKVEGAKIIDFGIAKDLDPSSATIVGDGFAGKLNYVAPEQLGDFGREMGAWTDVYSLALVMLAVIHGKPVNMGGSLVDAVDKRRSGPDLSGVPENIREVIEGMLKPNPKERFRSMDEVLKALGEPSGVTEIQYVEVDKSPVKKPVLIGGSIAALAAIAGLGWLAFGPDRVDRVALARTTIGQTLPSVECSWLDVGAIQAGDEQTMIRMTGVAGSPANAQSKISQALAKAGLPKATINFDEVAVIRPAGCSALETYSRIRKAGTQHMSVAQREFERVPQPAGAQYPLASQGVITVKAPAEGDFTIFGIEPEGILSPLVSSREELDQYVASFREAPESERLVVSTGPGVYQIKPMMNHTGWSGLVMISGDPPFDPGITQPALDARGEEWESNFVATASERDWKSEMIWFKSVDKIPN